MTRAASRLAAAMIVLLALSSPIAQRAPHRVPGPLAGSRHVIHHSDNASNGGLDQRDAAAHMAATAASGSGTSDLATASRPSPKRFAAGRQSARVRPPARAHAPAYLRSYSLLI